MEPCKREAGGGGGAAAAPSSHGVGCAWGAGGGMCGDVGGGAVGWSCCLGLYKLGSPHSRGPGWLRPSKLLQTKHCVLYILYKHIKLTTKDERCLLFRIVMLVHSTTNPLFKKNLA